MMKNIFFTQNVTESIFVKPFNYSFTNRIHLPPKPLTVLQINNNNIHLTQHIRIDALEMNKYGHI